MKKIKKTIKQIALLSSFIVPCIWVSTNTFNKNVSFVNNNYSFSDTTTIVHSIRVSEYHNLLPSKVSNAIIVKIILENEMISNTYADRTIYNGDIKLSQINQDDTLGKITTNVTLCSNKAKLNGKQINSLDLGNIEIFGFKEIKWTDETPIVPFYTWIVIGVALLIIIVMIISLVFINKNKKKTILSIKSNLLTFKAQQKSLNAPKQTNQSKPLVQTKTQRINNVKSLQRPTQPKPIEQISIKKPTDNCKPKPVKK